MRPNHITELNEPEKWIGSRKYTHLFFSLNQIKKFAFFCILEHYENVAAGVNELEMLDNVRMVKSPKHFDLSLDFLEDSLELDLAFVQYFNRHLVICDFVHGHYRAGKLMKCWLS